jgi:hypothetical protein
MTDMKRFVLMPIIIALIPSLDAGGQHWRGTPLALFHYPQEIWNPVWGLPPQKKLGIGAGAEKIRQWGSRGDHLVNRLRCAFLNGAKSTLAMFPETNLVWTSRSDWGIRSALLEMRS